MKYAIRCRDETDDTDPDDGEWEVFDVETGEVVGVCLTRATAKRVCKTCNSEERY